MRLRGLLCLIAFVCLGVFVLSAADVSGKWVAQMPGRGGETRETTFNFKADGDNLTGTMSGPRGDREISEGKISGDDISFVMVMRGRQGGEMKMVYKGKVSGNEIKFTVQREGADRTFEFVAKKAS